MSMIPTINVAKEISIIKAFSCFQFLFHLRIRENKWIMIPLKHASKVWGDSDPCCHHPPSCPSCVDTRLPMKLLNFPCHALCCELTHFSMHSFLLPLSNFLLAMHSLFKMFCLTFLPRSPMPPLFWLLALCRAIVYVLFLITTLLWIAPGLIYSLKIRL